MASSTPASEDGNRSLRRLAPPRGGPFYISGPPRTISAARRRAAGQARRFLRLYWRALVRSAGIDDDIHRRTRPILEIDAEHEIELEVLSLGYSVGAERGPLVVALQVVDERDRRADVGRRERHLEIERVVEGMVRDEVGRSLPGQE